MAAAGSGPGEAATLAAAASPWPPAAGYATDSTVEFGMRDVMAPANCSSWVPEPAVAFVSSLPRATKTWTPDAHGGGAEPDAAVGLVGGDDAVAFGCWPNAGATACCSSSAERRTNGSDSPPPLRDGAVTAAALPIVFRI